MVDSVSVLVQLRETNTIKSKDVNVQLALEQNAQAELRKVNAINLLLSLLMTQKQEHKMTKLQ